MTMNSSKRACILGPCSRAMICCALAGLVLVGCPGSRRSSRGDAGMTATDAGTTATDASISCEPSDASGCRACDWTAAQAGALTCFPGTGFFAANKLFRADCGAYNAVIRSGVDQYSAVFYDKATGRLSGAYATSFTRQVSCAAYDPSFVLPPHPYVPRTMNNDPGYCVPIGRDCPPCVQDGTCQYGEDAGTP